MTDAPKSAPGRTRTGPKKSIGENGAEDDPATPAPAAASRKDLPPAAQRALAEAEARRKAQEAQQQGNPKEVNGPKGPEPTRYGDWERKGITWDF